MVCLTFEHTGCQGKTISNLINCSKVSRQEFMPWEYLDLLLKLLVSIRNHQPQLNAPSLILFHPKNPMIFGGLFLVKHLEGPDHLFQ